MKRLAQALMLSTVTALPGWADSGGTVIVIPGRPGVPIIINGVDASYRVVEGDWGLGRGVQVQPTVYGGRRVDPVPRVGHYFPGSSVRPGYGRLEIEPPADRKLPKPAESYHESWSAESNPPAQQPAVPLDPPQVILAPPERGGYSPDGRPDLSQPRD